MKFNSVKIGFSFQMRKFMKGVVCYKDESKEAQFRQKTAIYSKSIDTFTHFKEKCC